MTGDHPAEDRPSSCEKRVVFSGSAVSTIRTFVRSFVSLSPSLRPPIGNMPRSVRGICSARFYPYTWLSNPIYHVRTARVRVSRFYRPAPIYRRRQGWIKSPVPSLSKGSPRINGLVLRCMYLLSKSSLCYLETLENIEKRF